MSFLTWRAIQDRLSIDSKVASLGISIEPGCYCCEGDITGNTRENIDHLFAYGGLAKKIWSFFVGPLSINYRNISFKLILLNSWNLKTSNPIAAFVSKIIPPIICWEIWKSRCSSKHEAIKPTIYVTKSNILFSTLQITRNKFTKARIGNSWSSLCRAMENAVNQKSAISVRWIKPPSMMAKLNSDGSSKDGQCGGGGLIRDNQGNFIFAYSFNLGQGTSNMAEASALLYGLKWCANNGINLVWGETDSLLLVKCIKREWKPPWKIAKEIQQIQNLVEENGFNISHWFREANKPADKLASFSHSTNGIQVFNSFSVVPRSVRGLINLDKWNLPSFRIRPVKPSLLVYDPP
ncbi:uncharacterized protein LOC132031987 [Lycium ferocissimum]|uniref:uncharacterized protein LOC132031987 n=1 Tax=Lycium ferocissimum TaxID=112874 RepID=UPI002816632D|nr:uncharacterized protein LOC132031987 [Lycium ferocissimum]